MRDDSAAFVLSEDITRGATTKGQKGSAVFSLRLTPDELAAIDVLSRSTGKSPSQIVREALKQYLHAERYSQPCITVSYEGATITTGMQPQSARPVEVKETFAIPT